MYEVMTAFFLEAGFLGIMLFGWQRVSPRAHFGATLMVAIGTLISTFWILASNSWMQTPQGFEVVNGHVVPLDWFKIIFNPSFPYRLAHMAIAAFIVAGLVVSAVGAWHLLRGRRDPAVKKMFSMALWLLLILTPIQAFVGDQHGLNTRKYQPAKIAAIEGLWETEKGGTALNLFGIPDMKAETTRYAVSIPHLGSLILTHSWDGEIRGLKEFPPQDRPNSTVVFWSFRIMAGLGVLMILMSVAAWALRRRERLFESKWFQRFAVAMGPTGFITLLAGWVTTEAGRQPWVVYGVMRTSQAVSPLTTQQVGISLMTFVVVYFLVFGTGIYYMLKLMRSGPALPGQTPHGVPAALAESDRAPPAVRRRSADRRRLNLPSLAACEKQNGCNRSVGRDHRTGPLHVCGAGRLRSGHRHRLPVLPRRKRARPDDEHRRAGLGRQRNLARARRRRVCSRCFRWCIRPCCRRCICR